VIIFTFIYNACVTQDIRSKIKFLREILLPSPSEADLSDILRYEYLKLLEMPIKLSIKKVKRAIRKIKKDIVLKLNKIPNKII